MYLTDPALEAFLLKENHLSRIEITVHFKYFILLPK